MKGNDEANEVADWGAGNANSRMLFLDKQGQRISGRISISPFGTKLTYH